MNKVKYLSRLIPDFSGLSKPSVMLIIFCFCFSFFTMDLWRKWHFTQNNFQWDVANYYSYLPAKFCNNDSFKFSNGVSDFLQVLPNGEIVTRATYGMAIMYSPFFALGYKIALNQKSPLDGFSEPFSTCLHWGSIFYSLLGLILLRNFLIKFYSERTTAFTLAIVFFGTMLFYYTYGDSEMTHGYLFFLISAFLLACYKWHNNVTIGRSVVVGVLISLISLIRPTEILVGLIFVLWGVTDLNSLKVQVSKFLTNWSHLVIMLVIFILIWIPQFIFWKNHTGSYFYSSYATNGEKFYWNDPQVLNVLFSYRKGWITYTPLIILSFIGLFFLKGEASKLKIGITFVLLLNLYILSCWWDWFFGGCFGARGFCQHIAFLAMPIAAVSTYFLDSDRVATWFHPLKFIFLIFVFSGICLNIGQSYQYSRGYIHFNSMTKESYWLVFGKYSLSGAPEGNYWKSLKEPDYTKLKNGADRNQ
ncbi:MAG: hypothetical protein JWO32_860 [Bacteroidetes bacterium]|nr:hypothetical protein [Bacteroidota bacterium]